jgi:hypothetical protein
VGRGAQGDTGEVQAKLFHHPKIHLVVHQPQGHLGNLRRELFDLYTVELVHVNADEIGVESSVRDKTGFKSPSVINSSLLFL